MVLCTCGQKKHAGNLGPLSHPCGKAGKALDDGEAVSGSGDIVRWAQEHPST
jgi:hypothetical protein